MMRCEFPTVVNQWRQRCNALFTHSLNYSCVSHRHVHVQHASNYAIPPVGNNEHLNFRNFEIELVASVLAQCFCSSSVYKQMSDVGNPRVVSSASIMHLLPQSD